jgi:hypothetical protein
VDSDGCDQRLLVMSSAAEVFTLCNTSSRAAQPCTLLSIWALSNQHVTAYLLVFVLHVLQGPHSVALCLVHVCTLTRTLTKLVCLQVTC